MKQLLGIFILAVLSLFFAAPFSYAQSKAPAGSTESSSGQAVNLTAKAAVLIEGNSGEIILEKNKDTELVPASITKIMTLTLIMEALEEGNSTHRFCQCKRICCQHGWLTSIFRTK